MSEALTATAKDHLKKVLDLQMDMTRFACSLCRDVHLAEDIVQDALLRCLNHIRKYGVEGSRNLKNHKAWTFHIVRNLWIDRCRTINRRPPHIPLERKLNSESQDDVQANVAEDSPAHWVKPYSQKDAQSRNGVGRDNYDFLFSDVIVSALRELPKDYEDAIVLAFVGGYTYKEVSKQLGIPVGTVRSRIFRGRSMLRDSLLELRRPRRRLTDDNVENNQQISARLSAEIGLSRKTINDYLESCRGIRP